MTKNDPPLPFFLKNKAGEQAPATAARSIDLPSVKKTPEPPVELNIPTLSSIAVPEDENNDPTAHFEPVLIGPDESGFDTTAPPPPESMLSNDDIRHIAEKLRVSLLPEIEKIVSYAMNHAFALAMDQASHVLRQKVHAKVDELLPQLVRDAIKNPPRKP